MLRFGLGLSIAVAAVACTTLAAALAQPQIVVVAARDAKTQPARRSDDKAAQASRRDDKAKSTSTAQPLLIPPLPERKTAKASPIQPPVPDVWTPAEIADAKARCTAALKGLDAEVTFEAPIKEGDCGTPAPIRLSRLGKVNFAPAALINCGMLAPLNAWISKDVQPAAARQLGAKITKIEVMSDYSCRTAFGRKGKKLSQHAYVDALDIRGFVTDNGQRVYVLEAWGANKRDIARAVAAAKAAQEKLAQAKVAAAEAEQENQRDPKADHSAKAPTNAAATSLGAPGSGIVKSTRRGGVDMVTVILPGGSKQQQTAARLGGPPDNARPTKSVTADAAKTAALTPAALAAPPSDPKARFLREAHAAACRIFGTTLGPEANEAHRNHFHVDMAERKIKKICD